MENVLCFSRDGVPLGPEKENASIDTTLHPPLFSLDSTFKQTR